jgi:cell division protein FtsX
LKTRLCSNRSAVSARSCDGARKLAIGLLIRSMSKITEASRDHIADENFAFPKERKEPIHDAAHVRNAIARFKQVQGVTDSERDAAWKRIKSAAKKHKVELNEQDWRELS